MYMDTSAPPASETAAPSAVPTDPPDKEKRVHDAMVTLNNPNASEAQRNAAMVTLEDLILRGHVTKHFRNFVLNRGTMQFDDALQTARILMLSVAKTFDPSRHAGAYIGKAIRNRMITLSRETEALRKKTPFSLNAQYYDKRKYSFDQDFWSTLEERKPDPPKCDPENIQNLLQVLPKILSPYEIKCLIGHSKGEAYPKKSIVSGKPTMEFKSVDNALQRVRQKMKKLIARSKATTADYDENLSLLSREIEKTKLSGNRQGGTKGLGQRRRIAAAKLEAEICNTTIGALP